MACYMNEGEIFKCPTHPSKRRRTGICPTCLRNRLNTLCPYCANLRPCACCPAAVASSTSSSSTSSFSFFSSASSSGDGEPSMRRSRSVAIPFLRSRSKYAANLEFVDRKPPPSSNQKPPLPPASDHKPPLPPASDHKPPLPPASEQRPPTGSNKAKSSLLLSIFSKNKKLGAGERENEKLSKEKNDFATMMKRSRSVSDPVSLNSGAGDNKSSAKARRWHFPSPMNAFRKSKSSKVLQEQAAMCN